MTEESKPKVVIDRSKWRTGGKQHNKTKGLTKLLNEKGYMCCLGFVCNQAYGIDDKCLFQRAEPVDVLVERPLVKDTYNNSDIAYSAMKINDNEHLSNEGREEAVKEILFPYYDIEFIGEYK